MTDYKDCIVMFFIDDVMHHVVYDKDGNKIARAYIVDNKLFVTYSDNEPFEVLNRMDFITSCMYKDEEEWEEVPLF